MEEWVKYRDANSSAMTAVSIYGIRHANYKMETLAKLNPLYDWKVTKKDGYAIIEYKTKPL